MINIKLIIVNKKIFINKKISLMVEHLFYTQADARRLWEFSHFLSTGKSQVGEALCLGQRYSKFDPSLSDKL